MGRATNDKSDKHNDGSLAARPLDDETAAILRLRIHDGGLAALSHATGIGVRGLERAAAQLPILATHRRAIRAALAPAPAPLAKAGK